MIQYQSIRFWVTLSQSQKVKIIVFANNVVQIIVIESRNKKRI